MYSIREARPQDIPAIEEHCRKQNERDGTNYPVPRIFDESWRWMPNIALAMVIVDEKGEVQQAAIYERTVEQLLFGCEPKATAQLHKEIEGVFYLLRQRGYEGVHCFVPKQVELPVSKPLEKVGFKRDDWRLAHYFKDLTEEEANVEKPTGTSI